MAVLIFANGSFRQSSSGEPPRADLDHRRKTMDTTKILADLKKRPGFTENVVGTGRSRAREIHEGLA